MGVLEQIEEIIEKDIKSENGDEIVSFRIYSNRYFILILKADETVIEEYIKKIELSDFLNKNGWEIKESD